MAASTLIIHAEYSAQSVVNMLCCFKNVMMNYLRILSWWLGMLITTCLLWIPVTALLFFALCVWIRRSGRRLLPELRRPHCQGDDPVVVGFFHPYCNAGGGGERVLWTAIRALQTRYANCRCVVYTGDIESTGEAILQRARQRFNISLPRSSPDYLQFVFLQKRQWVEASPYPYFTLLAQSFGSLLLGFEALSKYVPDIYLDTMGYAFTLPLFKFIGGCKVGCYVHYPTISTDMLEQVSQRAQSYNNAAFISRSPALSHAKLLYYKIFAYLYGMAGKQSQVTMVNSTWTHNHILSLWGAADATHIVYPPCDVKEFLSIPLQTDERQGTRYIVSVAQFRPEKDHRLQIKSFHHFLSGQPTSQRERFRLVLVGSCRNDEDAARVEALKQFSQTLEVDDLVDFRLNVSFSELKESLATATIGLHTMWNEHFGIGVVECMAAGTIILAHNSGGPQMDIVQDYNGEKTGYLAHDVESYAEAMKEIFHLPPEELLAIRTSARASVNRFSEDEFEQGFLEATQPLFM